MQMLAIHKALLDLHPLISIAAPKGIPWSSSIDETMLRLSGKTLTVSKQRTVGAWFSPDGEARLQALVDGIWGALKAPQW